MATRAITASPATPTQVLPAAPTPPTGTWQHPRIKEIERRREAGLFTRTKFISAALSLLTLLVTVWPLGGLFKVLLPAAFESLVLTTARILLALVAARNLQPLWRSPDPMTDIPLTPTQRSMLGLTPSSAPPTSGSTYITPPRFSRSTPRSDSSRAAVLGSSPQYSSSSPISRSPLAGRGVGSPYSPSSGRESPLVRKAIEGGRRSSAGGMGSLGLFDESKGSSSPSLGRSASVGLNSKWLYQRGKSRASLGASAGGLYS